MSKTGHGRLLATILGAAAVACLIYAGAGFFLVPRLIERQLTAMADQRLGQKLSIEKLKFNPFVLSVEATGVRLAQGNGPPILAARRVYLDLALLGSGFGRGWVLSEAQADGLQVQLELANGHLNLADLLHRWQQGNPPAKPGNVPVRMTIRHVLVGDGSVSYRESSGTPAATKVLPIRLELENVSTVPDREGHYSVAARLVDGGTMTWRGELSLLPLKSEGELSLEGLKLATIWKFIRDDVRLAEPEGTIGLATHYKFSYADGKPELGLTSLRLNASGLRVVREGFDEPILSLKTLEASNGNFQLDRRSLVLPVATLSNGSVNVVKDANGAWNWTGFLRGRDTVADAKKPAASPDCDRPAAQAWHIDMNAIAVDNVALRYEDRHRPKLLAVRTAAMQGKAAVAVIAGCESSGVVARDMDLRLEKLQLGAADSPAATLTALQVQGGYVDLSKHMLGAARLVVDGGNLIVERNANGAFPIAEPFLANGEPPSTAPPWRYAFGSVRVQGLDVALSDLSFAKQPIVYRFDGMSATFDNVAGAGEKAMDFKASARIASGGTISAGGSAAPDLSRINAEVKLNALALSPLHPFIARYALVDLVSGKASASATVAYSRAGGTATISASGPFELDNVRLKKAGTDETVLAWTRLSAAHAHLTLGPDRLSVKQIIVEAPEVKIDISEQRELNLAQLFRHEPARDQPTQPQPAADAQEAKFPVHIGELRVRDGIMDFADRSLALPFSTRVTNLAGTASGLGTNRDRHATLQFDGDIGESGKAQISGSLDAFAPKIFTAIDVAFENVELPDLSPYSVTFLGRKIDSGKLWVNLKYGIDNSQLTGNNDITIHDLKLGEPVDSPTAIKLPLDLAVALLTDSEGKIRVAVPVRGDLNNPKFDLGAVIREALGELIQRIVSAPFRALAGLFGQNQGKDISSVEFEAGSARLMPSEKEKLQEVAKAMSERPKLKLVVQAPYALDTDGAALKREMAGREVALALGRSLEPGEKPAPVVFESLGTQRALERLLAKKAASSVVRDLAAQYAKQTGAEPKRASLLLRTSGDPDFYKAMYAWLVESEPIAGDSMQNLAAGRANVVLDALRSAGTDPARLESGPAAAGKQEKGKRIAAGLSLELAGKSPSAQASPEVPVVKQASR
jgi:hypothetical protein